MAKKKPQIQAPDRLQEFYLRGNLAQPDDVLAEATGLDAASVRAFRAANSASSSPADHVFHRQNASGQRVQGFVAMTPEGSELTDRLGKRGEVTEDMIQRAIGARDFALADLLQKQKAAHAYTRETAERVQNAGRVHYIRPLR